jgi:hypothetical protein
LYALADARDVARLAAADHARLGLPGGANWADAELPAALRECADVLGDGKKREPDAAASLALLEALLALCATHAGRRRLRALRAYAVVKDCDYHFADGRDDRDDADANDGPAEVMVTADDAPEPDEATLTDDQRARKAINKTCSEIANMLLRDDGATADKGAEPPAPDPETYDAMD